MNKLHVAVAAAGLGAAVFATLGMAAENFQRLSGAQIRAKFSGMQLTDQVHWGEVYWPDGKLTSEEMGRKQTGTWRVQKGQLCTDYGQEGRSCYEVWMAGTNVELRTPGSANAPLEGVLERAPARR